MAVWQFVLPWGWAQSLLGVHWPAGDEDKLRHCGAAWRDAAIGLLELTGAGEDARSAVNAAVASASNEEFNKYWNKVAGGDGVLERLARQCAAMANHAENAATEVEATKIAMNVVAVILYLQIIEALISIAVSFGLDAPAAVAFMELQTRLAANVTTRLMRALIESLMLTVLPDLVAETVQMVQGRRAWGAYDGKLLLHDLEHGLVLTGFFLIPGLGGPLAKKLGGGLAGRIGLDRLAPLLDNAVTRNPLFKEGAGMVTGGVAMVAGNVATYGADHIIQDIAGVHGWAQGENDPFAGWQGAFLNGMFFGGLHTTRELVDERVRMPRLAVDTTEGDRLLLRRHGGALDPAAATDNLVVLKDNGGHAEPTLLGRGGFDGSTGVLTVRPRDAEPYEVQAQQVHVLDSHGQRTGSVPYVATETGYEPGALVAHGGEGGNPLPAPVSKRFDVATGGPTGLAVRGGAEPVFDPHLRPVDQGAAHVFSGDQEPVVVVAGDGVYIPPRFDRPLRVDEALVYDYKTGEPQGLLRYPGGDAAGTQHYTDFATRHATVGPIDTLLRPDPAAAAVAAAHARAASGIGQESPAAEAEAGSRQPVGEAALAALAELEADPAVPGQPTAASEAELQRLAQQQQVYAEAHPDRTPAQNDTNAPAAERVPSAAYAGPLSENGVRIDAALANKDLPARDVLVASHRGRVENSGVVGPRTGVGDSPGGTGGGDRGGRGGDRGAGGGGGRGFDPPDRPDPAIGSRLPGSNTFAFVAPATDDHVEAVRAAIEASFPQVVDLHGGFSIEPAGEAGVYRLTDLHDPDPAANTFTIRFETGWISWADAARGVLNHDKTAHVIQVSAQADPREVGQAVGQTFGELVADRERYRNADRPFGPDAGVLKPGEAPPNPELTPQDRGRIAQCVLIGEDLAHSGGTSGDAAHDWSRRDAVAAVEELGLREGTPGADVRRALVRDRLAAAPEALARFEHLLAEAGRAEAGMSAPERALLSQVRSDAAMHRALLADAEARAAGGPIARLPSGDTPISRDAAAELARQNREYRDKASAGTRGWLQEHQEPDGITKVGDAQLGGGGALAARDSRALLIDDRERWQADNGTTVAQIADQFRDLRRAGAFDPYRFVDTPAGRVPIDALSAWEDGVATMGPLVNGRATLRLDSGRLLADIGTAEGWAHVVDITGITTISTGFPPERIPGQPLPLREAISAVYRSAESDPALRRAVESVSWHDPAAAGEVLRALEQSSPDIPDDVRHCLELTRRWQAMRTEAPENVLTGDEANLRSMNPHAAEHWVVAGAGGTSISAVENGLRNTESQTFTMIGRKPPEGLVDNTQFQQVRALHDRGFDPEDPTAPSSEENINPGATGRLRLVWPAQIGEVTAAHDPATGRTVYTVAGVSGDGVIASIGRDPGYPPAVADLVDAVLRDDPSRLRPPELLFDDEGQYLGYRFAVDGHIIDVIGGASRFIPRGPDGVLEAENKLVPPPPRVRPADPAVWSSRDARAERASSRRDAPPESGNFDGGYKVVVLQAAAYGRFRRAELEPLPMDHGIILPEPLAHRAGAHAHHTDHTTEAAQSAHVGSSAPHGTEHALSSERPADLGDIPAQFEFARHFYSSISLDDSRDVFAILEHARAAGLDLMAGDIQGVKRHLFFTEHFDPDPDVAQAWQRLAADTHDANDLLLLRHELAERRFLQAGMTHEDAHEAANRVANWQDTLNREARDPYERHVEEHRGDPGVFREGGGGPADDQVQVGRQHGRDGPGTGLGEGDRPAAGGRAADGADDGGGPKGVRAEGTHGTVAGAGHDSQLAPEAHRPFQSGGAFFRPEPFGFRPLHRHAEWPAQAREFEEMIAAADFNDPTVHATAKYVLRRLRELLHALNERQTNEPPQKHQERIDRVFVSDDKQSAGTVGGTADPTRTVDRILEKGDVRDVMTAIFFGFYENYKYPETLANTLARIRDEDRWDEATAAGHDLSQARARMERMDGYLPRIARIYEAARRKDPQGPAASIKFGRNTNDLGTILLSSDRPLQNLALFRLLRWGQQIRSPEEQQQLSRTAEHYWDKGTPLSEMSREHQGLPLMRSPEDGTQPLTWREGGVYHSLDNWLTRTATASGLRVVDGPSGTTARMLVHAELAGLDPRLREDFIRSLAAWMLPGPDHSLLEVAQGAQVAGHGPLRDAPILDLPNPSAFYRDVLAWRQRIGAPTPVELPEHRMYSSLAAREEGLTEVRHNLAGKTEVLDLVARQRGQLAMGVVTDGPLIAGEPAAPHSLHAWLERMGVDPRDPEAVMAFGRTLTDAHATALAVYTTHEYKYINNVTRTHMFAKGPTLGRDEPFLRRSFDKTVKDFVRDYLTRLARGSDRPGRPPIAVRSLLHEGPEPLNASSTLTPLANGWIVAQRLVDRTGPGDVLNEGAGRLMRDAAWEKLSAALDERLPAMFDEARIHADMLAEALQALPPVGSPDAPVLVFRGDTVKLLEGKVGFGTEKLAWPVTTHKVISTSPDLDLGVKFIDVQPTEGGRPTLIVYELTGRNGRDITPFSVYQGAQEVVLPPGSRTRRVRDPERLAAVRELLAGTLPPGCDVIFMEEV